MDLSKPVVISCGWGVTVCVLYLAIEGEKRVYDGSWSEYSKRS